LEYFEFFLYGLIQGLTEFIPVSSTAHLKVISLLLGINDPGSSLSAVIQLGSILAVICYFKNDFLKIYVRKKYIDYLFNKKLIRSIFIGTIPIVLFGGGLKLFSPIFFEKILRSNLTIAIVSFVMAFYMYVADSSKKNYINIKNHNYSDSFLIGFSQAFAVIPGVSRSGVTISTALLTGWERIDAIKFSFLLGLPAITLAAVVELITSFNDLLLVSFLPLLTGISTAFLSSLFAIDFLIKYLPSNGMSLFIFYRVIFGIVILLNM